MSDKTSFACPNRGECRFSYLGITHRHAPPSIRKSSGKGDKEERTKANAETPRCSAQIIQNRLGQLKEDLADVDDISLDFAELKIHYTDGQGTICHLG